MPKKKGPPVLVDDGKCAGCLVCQLRCSLRFEKAFVPALAAIQVRRQVAGATEYKIAFTERCDNCGICVRFCPYGALTQQSKVEA